MRGRLTDSNLAEVAQKECLTSVLTVERSLHNLLMGNQESKPSASHHRGASSSQQSSHASNEHATSGTYNEKGKTVARRRESVHTSLPGSKTTASPSAGASLTSATATTTKSSRASAEDSLKRAAHPQTQQPTSSTPQLRPVDAAEAMGTSASKNAAAGPAAITTPKPAKQTGDPASRPSPLPRPIDVPSAQAVVSSAATHFSPVLSNASGFVDASYTLATPAQFSRPPRLPLPIEQEVHAPGSPIISPADIAEPIEGEAALPRRASVLSSTTVDDDDLGDDVNSMEPWNGAQARPTLLEWREDGEKVYVTGTFAGWDKKFRLHRK